MNDKEIIAMSIVAILITVIMVGGSFLSLTNGQSQTTSSNNNTGGTGGATKKPLPVLLIHGYGSDASAQ